MTSFRINKLANALIPSATTFLGGYAQIGTSLVRKHYGGLWVGGSVELSAAGVSFRANSMNEAVHTGGLEVDIPLRAIRSVVREFGWITGIVVVAHEGGVFRFRCFGAKRVAQEFSEYLAHAS